MRRLGGLGATGSRVTRRTIVAAGAAGASASLAAACGTGQREAAQASKAQGPASVKLTYRVGQEVFFDELAATFMQREPQVKVTTEGFPGNEYFTKLDVLFAGGSQSDLTWVSSIEAYFDHTARGNFLAIDPYIKSDRVDLKEWFGGAVEMLRVKSGLYALPLWSHPSSVALYYNKDLDGHLRVGTPARADRPAPHCGGESPRSHGRRRRCLGAPESVDDAPSPRNPQADRQRAECDRG